MNSYSYAQMLKKVKTHPARMISILLSFGNYSIANPVKFAAEWTQAYKVGSSASINVLQSCASKENSNIFLTDIKFLPLKLSQILDKYPQFFDEIKISVVSKNVNAIDRLPQKYKNIEVLYLSNNNLTSLEGIQQFKRLRTVTLAHNKLSDTQVLEDISKLPQLECLNLTGNPLAKHPNYKLFLVSSLPNLKTLDGKMITEDTRIECEVKYKQQKQLLQLILKNYCEVLKLTSFLRKLSVHRDMISKQQAQHRFAKQNLGNREISLSAFVNNFKLFESLEERDTEQFLDIVRAQLLSVFIEIQQESDQDSLENSPEVNYEKAFQETIRRQNVQIASLHVQLDKLIEHYNGFLASITHRSVAFSPSATTLPPKSERLVQRNTHEQQVTLNTSPSASSLSINNKSIVNQQNGKQSANSSSLQRSVSNPDIARQAQTHSNNQPVRVNPRSIEQQGQVNADGQKKTRQSDSSDITPNRVVPQPSLYESKPSVMSSRSVQLNGSHQHHGADCCKRHMRSDLSRSISPSELSGKPTAYKRRNKELEQMVFEMSKQLADRDEEINALRELSVNVKGRLVEVNSKSEIQAKKAINEIAVYMRELEQKESSNRVLVEETKDLRRELNQLLVKNYELSDAERSSTQFQSELAQLQSQFLLIKSENEMAQLADAFSSKRILRKGFHWLVYASQTTRVVEQFRDKWAGEKQLLRKSYSVLKRRWLIRKYARVMKQEKDFTAANDVLQTWKQNSRFSVGISRVNAKKSAELKATAFLALKQKLGLKSRKERVLAKVQLFREKQLRKQAWRSMKSNYKQSVLSQKQVDVLMNRSVAYEKSKLKRKYMKVWKYFMESVVRVKQYQEQQITRMNRRRQLRLGVDLLVENRKEGREQAIKVAKYMQIKRKKLVRSIFGYLSGGMLQVAQQKRVQKQLVSTAVKQRMLRRWQSAILEAKREQLSLQKAKVLRVSQIVKRHFAALKAWSEKLKKERYLCKALATMRENALMQQSLAVWVSEKQRKRGVLQERRNEERRVLGSCVDAWIAWRNARVEKKRRREQLIAAATRKLALTQRDVFVSWTRIVRRKNRNARVVENLLEKRESYVMRISLYALSRELAVSRHRMIVQLNHAQSILQADFTQQQELVGIIDEEKAEIALNSRELMQQNVVLQQYLAEQNAEIALLKRSIVNYEKSDQAKVEIIGDLEEKVQAQERMIDTINREHETQLDLEESTQKHMRLDNKGLLKEIATLQRQIEGLQRDSDEREKFFKNQLTEMASEKAAQDSRLQNSVEMASAFKEKIESQSNRIEELEHQVIELTDSNAQQKNHIAECVSVIQQFESTYDSKVVEYEAIINDRSEQLEQVQSLSKEQTNLLEEQRLKIKTLEYEIALLTEQQRQATTEFIADLQRGTYHERTNTLPAVMGASQSSMLNKRYDEIQSNEDQLFISPRMTMQSQGPSLNGTTSKSYKILQNSFSRQRSQMKDKIRSLTEQIEGQLQQPLSSDRRQMKSEVQQPIRDEAQEESRRASRVTSKKGSSHQQQLTSAAAINPLSSRESNPRNSTAAFYTERMSDVQQLPYQSNHTAIAAVAADNYDDNLSLEEANQFQNLFFKSASFVRGNGKSSRKDYQVYNSQTSSRNSNTPVGQKDIMSSLNNLSSIQQAVRTSHQPNHQTQYSEMNLRTEGAPQQRSPRLQQHESSRLSRTQKTSASVAEISMLQPTDQLISELEKQKSNQKAMKSQIQLRIKNLHDHLNQDISNLRKVTL